VGRYLATHRKAIAGALLTAAAAFIASVSAGASWQAATGAAVVGALGGGAGVGAIPNRRKPL